MNFFEQLDSGIIEGGRRSGKSNHLLFLMNLAYSMGYEIITNMNISISHKKLNNLETMAFMNDIKGIMKERWRLEQVLKENRTTIPTNGPFKGKSVLAAPIRDAEGGVIAAIGISDTYGAIDFMECFCRNPTVITEVERCMTNKKNGS